MSFGTIFAGIVVTYVIYYAGNIIYDLKFKKSPEDKMKTDEEEVDIDEIAREVIKTQEINKHSLADFIPPVDSSDIEGDINCEAILKYEELKSLISQDGDDPRNPFQKSKIAFWVDE